MKNRTPVATNGANTAAPANSAVTRQKGRATVDYKATDQENAAKTGAVEIKNAGCDAVGACGVNSDQVCGSA